LWFFISNFLFEKAAARLSQFAQRFPGRVTRTLRGTIRQRRPPAIHRIYIKQRHQPSIIRAAQIRSAWVAPDSTEAMDANEQPTHRPLDRWSSLHALKNAAQLSM
jgi:hypothetical protein